MLGLPYNAYTIDCTLYLIWDGTEKRMCLVLVIE